MSNLPKKAEDKVNVFGIVVVGISAAILLWSTAVALQAYYLNTAGPVESGADQLSLADQRRAVQSSELANLSRLERSDRRAADGEPCYRNPIEVAMANVVADARAGKELLVPAVGPYKPTLQAIPGYPAPDKKAATADEPSSFEIKDGELSTGFTVTFDDANALSEETQANLARLAEFITSNPAIKSVTIVSENTDARLAASRAQKVRAFLASKGVDPSLLVARGQSGPAAGVWFEAEVTEPAAPAPDAANPTGAPTEGATPPPAGAAQPAGGGDNPTDDTPSGGAPPAGGQPTP